MKPGKFLALMVGCLLLSSTAGANEPLPTSVRAQRKWSIGGELAWNGLAGMGALGTYNVTPHVSLDMGLGLSVAGLKWGTRVRANLLKSEWTPFVGAGFVMGMGSGGTDAEVKTDDGNAKIRMLASPYLQTVVGVNYTGRGGLTLMGTAGYAFLLRDHNVDYVSGSRSVYNDVADVCDSGIVLGVSAGYVF